MGPVQADRTSRPARWRTALLGAALAGAGAGNAAPGAVGAEPAALTAPVLAQALAVATQAARALAPPGARVEAEAGALDPRLRLAPCARVSAYPAPGAPAWGRTRVGLRCLQGSTAWNVFLPVTVQVWAPAAVAAVALPAGASLGPQALQTAEVDWAAAPTAPAATAALVEGRVLARPVAAGQAVRAADLQPRQWFALGDTVQVQLAGAGFAITTEGQAITAGLEGQQARVRTAQGRTLVGRAVGDRRLEVRL